MPAKSNDHDNSDKDKNQSKIVRYEKARSWILKYKKSNFSTIMLSECMKMEFNGLALITKLLMDDIELQEENQTRLPAFFLLLMKQTYVLFKEKKLKAPTDPAKFDVEIEDFISDKLSIDALEKTLQKWNPEINDNFTFFVLKFRTLEIHKRLSKLRKTETEFNSYRDDRSHDDLNESVLERYQTILSTVILHIADPPHKKIIFFYTTLFYSIKSNKALKSFILDNFSDSMMKLYIDIHAQNISKKFNDELVDYFEKDVLKSRMDELYKGKRYKDIILKAGKNVLFGDIIISIFFFKHYENYPENPDYIRIRNLISKWNSRFKYKTAALMTDNERGIDLIDITKDS